MSPFPYLQIISLLQTDPIKYYLILCVIVIACAIPIYFAISKLSTLIGCNRSSSQHCQCSKCSLRRPKKANIVQNTNPKPKQNKNKSKSLSLLSPNRSIKRPKSYISPSKSKQKKVIDDADIESDIINELDQYHKTKGENRKKQNQVKVSSIEGLTQSIISTATNTTPKNIMTQQQFEKYKALEQELSNTKLLNHYTELRLKKKEKECQEFQTSEKLGRHKIRELMNEIASISKKNTDLMTYCEKKVGQCRDEYERMSKKSFQYLSKNKQLEKDIIDLKRKLSINATFKNECTKLRAGIIGYKTQIKESNDNIDKYKKDIKHLRNNVETQKYRLNETSKVFNKMNDEIASHKQEIKKLKHYISKHKDKVSELTEHNQELIEENKEIKLQIERFSLQLKQQSMIQNQIIDIQQQLNVNKSPNSIQDQENLEMMTSNKENDKQSGNKQDLIFTPKSAQITQSAQ